MFRSSPLQHPLSLYGSLESFPLAKVLSLLAAPGHTGALEVHGDGEGRVFLEEGAVVAAEAGPAGSPVDAVAELLRLQEGDFTFAPDEVPDRPGPPVAVAGLLADARARLDEWFAIEAVLPSVDHAVVLSPTAPAEEIVISAEQWRALAAIGGGGRVGLLFERLADDDLDALRLLKELVDAGLLEVVDPQVWSDPEGAGSRRPPGSDDPEGEWHGRLPGVASATSGTEPPVIVVRPTKPLRRPDPVLEARMDALASQLDVLYDGLQAAETEDVEAGGGRTGLFGRLRRRHDL